MSEALEEYGPEDETPSDSDVPTAPNSVPAPDTAPAPDIAPAPTTARRVVRPAAAKSTGQKKKAAETIDFGTGQRTSHVPTDLPWYQIDEEIEEVLTDARQNKRTTGAQTDNVTVIKSTQTDEDLQTELLWTILNKIENLEKSINRNDEKSINRIDSLEKTVSELKTSLLSTRPAETSHTSSVVTTALNALNDPYDFGASEVFFSTPTMNGPNPQPAFSTPRRRPMDKVHELGFWKLLPCEVLSTDTATILEQARSISPSELFPQEVSPS